MARAIHWREHIANVVIKNVYSDSWKTAVPECICGSIFFLCCKTIPQEKSPGPWYAVGLWLPFSCSHELWLWVKKCWERRNQTLIVLFFSPIAFGAWTKAQYRSRNGDLYLRLEVLGNILTGPEILYLWGNVLQPVQQHLLSHLAFNHFASTLIWLQ